MSNVDESFILKERVAALQQSILDRHPQMPTLLREIHTALRAQPENVTLMSEEDIAVITSGLKIQTQTEFAQTALSKAKAPSALKRIKEQGADAF